MQSIGRLRRKHLLSMTVLVVALLLAAGLYGCASKAQVARERAMEKAVKQHTYETDIEEVVDEARSLLSKRGYPIEGSRDGYAVTTGWREYDLDNPVGKKRKHYLVETTENQVFLKYEKESFSHGAWSPTVYTGGIPRDFDLEYELIKRVEPDRAETIKDRADRAARKAKGS